ncbi:MAG: alpha/beta hydrolase fold domain-containing protein [Solirubrobacteraceae bacterium]
MTGEPRRVRWLLMLMAIPLLILAGLLASSVFGQHHDALPAPVRPPVAPARVAPAAAAARPAAAPAFLPAGAERLQVGEGARGATIFRPRGAAGRAGPVVILLHGWVAIDPRRYGPWIAHLVRGGATVIYPAYQTKPARETASPLANVLAGVRAALSHVAIAPGRLVVAGHSVGAALAADYAAVAAAADLPAPAAILSVYPGRRLRHLATPIPSVDLSAIAPGTRLLTLAGERDRSVGSDTARRIVADATRANATLRIVRDDAVDDHSAPRRSDAHARRAFWRPLDELLAATAPVAPDRSGASALPGQ